MSEFIFLLFTLLALQLMVAGFGINAPASVSAYTTEDTTVSIASSTASPAGRIAATTAPRSATIAPRTAAPAASTATLTTSIATFTTIIITTPTITDVEQIDSLPSQRRKHLPTPPILSFDPYTPSNTTSPQLSVGSQDSPELLGVKGTPYPRIVNLPYGPGHSDLIFTAETPSPSDLDDGPPTPVQVKKIRNALAQHGPEDSFPSNDWESDHDSTVEGAAVVPPPEVHINCAAELEVRCQPPSCHCIAVPNTQATPSPTSLSTVTISKSTATTKSSVVSEPIVRMVDCAAYPEILCSLPECICTKEWMQPIVPVPVSRETQQTPVPARPCLLDCKRYSDIQCIHPWCICKASKWPYCLPFQCFSQSFEACNTAAMPMVTPGPIPFETVDGHRVLPPIPKLVEDGYVTVTIHGTTRIVRGPWATVA